MARHRWRRPTQQSRRSQTGEGRERKAPEPGEAYDVAVRLLGLRAHSGAELSRKLVRRGFGRDVVEATVARLTSQAYLDDAEFARALVNHRGGSRGGAAIAAELAAKGVARSVAQSAVAEMDGELEIEAAVRFARRWLPRAEPGSLRSLLNVAGSRLARRGYSPSVVREACRRALEAGTA